MKRHSLLEWAGGTAIAGALTLAMGIPGWSATGGTPSNSTTFTQSTSTVNHDTQKQVNITSYETQVLGISTIEVSACAQQYANLAHDNLTVYNQSFASAPTSSEVALAIDAANAAVRNDLAQAPRGEQIVNPAVEAQTSTSSSSTAAPVVTFTGKPLITTTEYVGPQTILVGDNQGTSWFIDFGGINIDTLTTTDVYRDVTTTTTTDLKSVFTVTGSVLISPIVLNLNGSGKLEASEGHWKSHPGTFYMGHRVFFDFYGNGFPVAMEWVGPSDGLLVKPKADGTVDGTCLFGTSTGYANGYENLASLDDNLDGRLTGKELKGLSVWQDSNGDAKVQPGELKTLEQLGITELNIRHKDYKSTFTMKGKSCAMYDWWPNTFEVKKLKVKLKPSV